MFKSVIALFFCALSITVTANPLNTMDFFDCGSSSDLMPVKALKIMPFPPKIGDTLTVVAAGALKEDIVEGSKAVVYAYDSSGKTILFQEEIDICKAAAAAGKSCPLKAGDQVLASKYVVNENTPKDPFLLRVIAANPNGKQIHCYEKPITLAA